MNSSKIAPAAMPRMRPSPPKSETPPTTAAAMAVSSHPLPPTEGSATFIRPITKTPTTPASTPLATYAHVVRRATGIPANRAASALPPTA